MRIDGWVAQFGGHSLFEGLGDKVLQSFGFVVQFLNGVAEHFEEEGFYKPVMPNDLKGSSSASDRKAHAGSSFVIDQRLRFT